MGLFSGGRDPHDILVDTLQLQLQHAHEREKELLRQLDEANSRLSAMADSRAHAAARRQVAPPVERKEREPESVRFPPYAAALAGGGHLNIAKVRDTFARQKHPIGVVPPPKAS